MLRYTATMTWKGVQPIVHLVTKTYAKGVTLTKKAMAVVEALVTRHPGLEPWFVEIKCAPTLPMT